MRSICDTSRLFDKYYYKRAEFINGTQAFHDFCASYVDRRGLILEIGAGPSNRTSDFFATLGTVCGVDVSVEIAGNRALASWQLFDGKVMPFDDNSFDYCFSNWVLEHVENPAAHFREVNRVLRPGGLYCLRTMNTYHYVGAISKLTPHWFHDAVANRVRALPNTSHEPWPTFYHCNTVGKIKRIARKAGFDSMAVKTFEAEPSYGRAHPVLFYPMFFWERAVNAGESLRLLRAGIFASVRKKNNGRHS